MRSRLNSEVESIKNINISSAIGEIAGSSLSEFFSVNNSIADYEALFNSYFNEVFIDEIDNYFKKILKNASNIDANLFFIKASQFIEQDKNYKKEIYTSTWSNIQLVFMDVIYEDMFIDEEDELYSFLNSYLFDFLVHSSKVSNLFVTLKNSYDNGLLNEEKKQLSKKLKTNLTVPELILLFRSLYELKSSVFILKSNEELFEFIAQNFETKKSSDLSKASIKNKFYEFDEKAKDFWQKNFSTMQNFVSKLEQK